MNMHAMNMQLAAVVGGGAAIANDYRHSTGVDFEPNEHAADGVTAGQARHNSINVGGVTGQVRHNSST